MNYNGYASMTSMTFVVNNNISLQLDYFFHFTATIECLKTLPKRPHMRAMRPHTQPQRIKLARVELPALADVRGATATLTVRVPIQIEQSGRLDLNRVQLGD